MGWRVCGGSPPSKRATLSWIFHPHRHHTPPTSIPATSLKRVEIDGMEGLWGKCSSSLISPHPTQLSAPSKRARPQEIETKG
eukprot:6261454-Amphidinium_carterae.1